MTSSFGWLDADASQRRRMLEIVDLFKDEGTVDELGIGAIRDALSGALFPGISTLHTRLRYVLFVPWLMQHAAHKPSPAEMGAEFRALEYKLIGSLLEGGEQVGVIGSRARDRLKRLPSATYWSALGAWGVREADLSADVYFRRRHDAHRLARRIATADDPEAQERPPRSGLDPHLPAAPDDLLRKATFELSAVEEEYLSHVIARETDGSMLAWLILHQPVTLSDLVWELPGLSDAPARLAETVDHARRFHTAIHGAALLYNLLLARKRASDELVDHYEAELDAWRVEVDETRALDGWDRAAWWATVARNSAGIRPPTRAFVDSWITLAATDAVVERRSDAASLVATRERQIKGSRARLANQAALDRWSGASGTGRLDYTWSIARRHLRDLYAARVTA